MITVEELNDWLEIEAFIRWPEYYMGLKDIDSKDSFVISSFDWQEDNLLGQWAKENHKNYITEGGTGYCIYTKIK